MASCLELYVYINTLTNFTEENVSLEADIRLTSHYRRFIIIMPRLRLDIPDYNGILSTLETNMLQEMIKFILVKGAADTPIRVTRGFTKKKSSDEFTLYLFCMS
jgi:hypothetical protein